MADKNEGFVFFQTYYEAMQYLADGDRLALYDAICKYALYGEEPTDLPPAAQGQFILQRPNIDASLKRYKANRENGKKGGAPKGNQNAKKQPNNNPNSTEKQPKFNLNKDKDKDKDKDKESDKESIKAAKASPTRHQYGEYSNVLLSDEELDKLKAEFPTDWQSRIERLSGYIASTGKRYKNHLATIRNWAKKDAQDQRPAINKGDWAQDVNPNSDYEDEEHKYGITI